MKTTSAFFAFSAMETMKRRRRSGRRSVFDLVSFGVCYGIADGVRVQFDADDFSGIAGCDEADGSDSAVGVHDAFVSGEAGQGDGFSYRFFV